MASKVNMPQKKPDDLGSLIGVGSTVGGAALAATGNPIAGAALAAGGGLVGGEMSKTPQVQAVQTKGAQLPQVQDPMAATQAMQRRLDELNTISQNSR
jgi:hypothetical protein